MTPVDLTKVLKKSHVGKWVALSREEKEVVGVGATPKKAIDQAHKNGCDDPVLHKVVAFNRAFAPIAS